VTNLGGIEGTELGGAVLISGPKVVVLQPAPNNPRSGERSSKAQVDLAPLPFVSDKGPEDSAR